MSELAAHNQLACREAGEGRPMVLLHGIGASSRVWSPLVRTLAGFRTLSYDLPGHGASSMAQMPAVSSMSELAEAVRSNVAARRLGPAVVCGHSAGAILALSIALDDPSLVSHLVLIATDAGRSALRWLADGAVAQLARTEGMDAVFAFSLEHDPTMADVRQDADQVEAYRGAFVRTDPAGFAALADALVRRPDLVPRLPELECPVLVICGSRDSDFLVPSRLIADTTGGRFVEVGGAGHLPMLDDTARVAREIQVLVSDEKEL